MLMRFGSIEQWIEGRPLTLASVGGGIDEYCSSKKNFACGELSSTLIRLHTPCYIDFAAPVSGTQSHLGVTKVAALITPSGLHQAESDHVSVED